MDSNKKKVMEVNRRVKEHQKVFRPRNKDVNAMKAMKVTMKAMKLRVSRPELHKALIKDIKFTLLKTNTECKARKAQSLATKIFGALRLNDEPRRAKNFRSVLEVLENEVSQSVKNNSVNEKWHRK